MIRERVAVPAAWFLIVALVIAVRAPALWAQSRPPLGVIDGIVTDTSLAPIGDATVSIIGSRLNVVTGGNGRFRISDVAPGAYIVLIRRIGFEAASANVQVTEADTLRLAFSLERIMTRLDTVVVEGPRATPRFSEFDARRLEHTATASISRDEILKRNPVDTWQMLSTVTALKVRATR